MVRPPDPTIKARLLDQCLDAFVEMGVSECSLRKIAIQVGTSARMLVYHFGSAEEFFAEMIMAYSQREKARLEEHLNGQEDIGSLAALIELNWKSYFAEERGHVLTAFVEIYGNCLRDKERYTPFFREMLFEWFALIKRIIEQRLGLPPAESTAWATLIVAACRGLLMDWLGSGETARVGDAVQLFKELALAYDCCLKGTQGT